MLSIIEVILDEPIKGLITVLFVIVAYLWREQAKIEERLDRAKLDKSTFNEYKDDHEGDHKNFEGYFKMIIDLIRGMKSE